MDASLRRAPTVLDNVDDDDGDDVHAFISLYRPFLSSSWWGRCAVT